MSLEMMISLLPVTATAKNETQENEAAAQAAETPVEPATSGDCGATENDHVKWSFDSRTGVRTISGTGAMADWKAHGKNASTACGNEAANVSDTTCEVSDCYLNRPWQSYKDQITKVVIKQGVTTIGSHAFFLCSNLESVSIPEGVTTIEDRAFWQTSLKNITIPASVTQIGSTIKEVFYQCYNLEDITVASGNTAYKSVDGVLYTADGTTLIQYPQNKADTSYKMIDEATKIDFLAFNYTQNLQTIDFNNVTEFADKAVYGNQALQEIVLKNAASLGNQAFSGNREVTSVLLEKAPTTVGESVFSSCASLANVTLPDDMKELQDGMFAFCTALKTLKFPAQLNRIGKACFDKAGLTGDLVIPASVTSIGNLAFRNCFGLTSITVEGTPTFESQGFAFQFCKNLLWMKASFNITKYFGGLGTADEYQGFEKQNSAWFTSEGTQVFSDTPIGKETIFYRWFAKKVPLNANGGRNNGNVQEIYAFFAPALNDGETIPFVERYYVGQTSYIINVNSDDFTREGYTFKEWTGDVAGEKPYEIGKYIYNYMPNELYAQWSKVIDEDTYFVSPVIADQTYTGSALEPAVKVTKNGEVISDTEYSVKYSSNTNVGTATATVKVGDTVIGTATFNIVKATPTLTITASPASLRGVGKVTLTVSGVPSSEGTAAVTCDNGISVTKNEDGTYSASLPNRTATYTFTLSYTGATDGNYNDKTTTCEVAVTRRYSSSTTVTPEPTPEPTPEETVKFSDVSTSAYYYDAVKWAVENGVTDGVSATLFAPYESCTRAEIVTFLWRAAGSPEPKTASSFSDVPASAYYAKAVAWAVENGITNGMTETTFAPDATCTRGQSVTFLYRALKGSASGSANFTDVKSDTFYADAINWAVANNVTNGTSNTTFSPNADCTRAEIVTFLYRAYQGK